MRKLTIFVPQYLCFLMRYTHSTLLLLVSAASLFAEEFPFRAQELKTRLQVGYAVRLVDMNDDDRLDICIVDSKRILWLQNPNWEEHVLTEDATKTDNVCFAPYDINSDGRVDFAVGADWTLNTQRGGTIGWITGGEKPTEPWQEHKIGEEPTVHRMQFADFDADGRAELIVAPLLGRDSTRPHFAENGVRLLSYKIPADPAKGPWEAEVINDELHVTHNIWPTDLNRDGRLDLLAVSFEGVHLLERSAEGKWKRTRVGEGNQKTSPNKGASEVKHGKLAGGGDYIATIEPWHGTQVVVYTPPSEKRDESSKEWLWNRQVLDEELSWGHAVSTANLDDDEDEELIIGVRDDTSGEIRRGVRIYDPTEGGKKWTRTLLDPGSVAVEDLAVGDLNGDGKADIVAVGRQTHNVVIYFAGEK